MKIVCDSCGAKYSIADEKVAGKIFKIRCKKCSSVLEVRGEKQASKPPEESTQVYDYGSESVWYVVVEGEQQGPLAPIQLTALFAKGSVGLDSYVWQEGFDDWKVASDVPELAQLLTGAPAGAQPAAAQNGAAVPSEPAPAPAVGMGGDLFSDGGGDAPQQPQAEGNIFAAFDSEAPAADDVVDVPTVAASPAQQHDMAMAAGGGAAAPMGDGIGTTSGSGPMTGARNENSVLFSLGNLQQLAAQEPAGGGAASAGLPSQSPQRMQPSAGGEGSGLIDIRALAQSTSPGAHDAPAAADDLLAIGAGVGVASTGTMGPLLGPTPLETAARNPWVLIGGGAAALLAVVFVSVGIGAMMGGSDEPTVEVKAAAPVGTTTGTPVAKAPTEPPADTVAVAPAIDAEQPDDPFEDPAPTIKEPEPKKRASSRSRKSKKSRTRSQSKATASTSKRKKKSSNLDALMDDVIGDAPKKESSSKKKSTSSSSGLPSSPSRNDVKRALSGVSGSVRRCKKGDSGTALVKVRFSGKTGRASSAKVVSGPFKGTAVGKGVEKAVKKARLPRFKQSTFEVKFPYRL